MNEVTYLYPPYAYVKYKPMKNLNNPQERHSVSVLVKVEGIPSENMDNVRNPPMSVKMPNNPKT
jgi:hypothetical protein